MKPYNYITKVYKQGLLPLFICDVNMDCHLVTSPWLNTQARLSGSAWPMNA